MIYYWHSAGKIKQRIYIPKYYDPSISNEIQSLGDTHDLLSLQQLVDDFATIQNICTKESVVNQDV